MLSCSVLSGMQPVRGTQGLEAKTLRKFNLINADSNLAIGWVHNLNAYWENKYYLKGDMHEFLSCDDPDTQSVVLEGFQTGVNMHVTWFPTRMNSTVDELSAGPVAVNRVAGLSSKRTEIWQSLTPHMNWPREITSITSRPLRG